jgi:predicted O-methyltransferase YrrM
MTGSAGIGPHLRHLLRQHIKYARKPRRYRQLLRAVREIMPRTILEIGVYNGVRAIEMIEAASLGRPVGDITYFGFDLFESMTAATMESELSKWPSPESSIRERLGRTGARIELYKGFTQDTLPAFAAARAGGPIDVAFIDGGHAVDTIRSDWRNLEPLVGPNSVVLFDDYYRGSSPLTERFGCNAVIAELDTGRFECTVLPDIDRFQLEGAPLDVSIVRVRRRP